MSERHGSDIERLCIWFTTSSIDPSFPTLISKNEMAWVRTTLKILHENNHFQENRENHIQSEYGKILEFTLVIILMIFRQKWQFPLGYKNFEISRSWEYMNEFPTLYFQFYFRLSNWKVSNFLFFPTALSNYVFPEKYFKTNLESILKPRIVDLPSPIRSFQHF